MRNCMAGEITKALLKLLGLERIGGVVPHARYQSSPSRAKSGRINSMAIGSTTTNQTMI